MYKGSLRVPMSWCVHGRLHLCKVARCCALYSFVLFVCACLFDCSDCASYSNTSFLLVLRCNRDLRSCMFQNCAC